MPVQDDVREQQMVNLFNLTVPEDRSRADIDAHLLIDGHRIDFELKSTTSTNVSTVRDFGPAHIRRWRKGLHWIFAFYDRTGTKLHHCIYASPADMEPWIAKKEEYIKPDVLLADSLPGRIDEGMVVSLFGEADSYTPAQARSIMKGQWGAADYLEHRDVPGGYSLTMMTEILRLRARYVIERGSTLNNPHIEKGFFTHLDKITSEHAATLREKVRAYLASTSATETATW